ncbi:MAG: DsbA family protein [Rickettsiales bacterium]|nr:DsbA family protein [Rickettsiales bacterium]
MLQKYKKLVITVISFFLLIGFGLIIINNYKTKTSFKYKEMTKEELEPETNVQDEVSEKIIAASQKPTKKYQAQGLLKVTKSDRILGDKNAPIVMVEYASLSCPHCASFNRESFGKIKKKYIDSGKLLFVYRNFPLNQPALNAAMYASCHAKDDNEKYFLIIKNLFKTQDAWAFDARFEKRLEALAKLEGMSESDFKKCMNNEQLKQDLLTHRIAVAKSLNVKSVPAFFINGELSSGYVDYVTFEKAIEKKLNE